MIDDFNLYCLCRNATVGSNDSLGLNGKSSQGRDDLTKMLPSDENNENAITQFFPSILPDSSVQQNGSGCTVSLLLKVMVQTSEFTTSASERFTMRPGESISAKFSFPEFSGGKEWAIKCQSTIDVQFPIREGVLTLSASIDEARNVSVLMGYKVNF